MRFVRHMCPTLVVGRSVIERDYYRRKLNERLLNDLLIRFIHLWLKGDAVGIESDFYSFVCRKFLIKSTGKSNCWR